MMRFIKNEKYELIEKTIKEKLLEYGFWGYLARDKYLSEDLWENIELYMNRCNFGMAVFEMIEESDFNPNISIELGYLIAQRKKCLLLKEKQMKNLPTDFCGRLYRSFDKTRINISIEYEIEEWMKDLGYIKISKELDPKLDEIFFDTKRKNKYLAEIFLIIFHKKEGIKYKDLRRIVTLEQFQEDGNYFSRNLQKLIDNTLVLYEKIGQIGIYRINPEHYVYIKSYIEVKIISS